MDAQPTTAHEAVQAEIRPASEDAGVLIQRIVDTHRWLTDQQAFVPELGTQVSPAAAQAYMDELATFWRASVAPYPDHRPMPRKEALALRWGKLMEDEAVLRASDGSLSEQARHAVLDFTAMRGHTMPSHLQARQLMVGPYPYAGTLVLADSRAGGIALLFTPDHGWEAFAHLDALYEEFEARLRETLAAHERVPGLADEDLVLSDDLPVSSEEIAGSPIVSLVDHAIDLQRRRATDAWTQRDDRDGSMERLADRLRDALAPENYLDATAILHHRQARLLMLVQGERLAQLPTAVRNEWLDTLAVYRRELADTRQVLANHGFHTLASIEQFRIDELRSRLQDHGVMENPADITVELFTTGGNVTFGHSGTDVERRPLLDLAREGIGFLDMRGMQAVNAKGHILSGLWRDDIIAMIRSLDIRNAYQAYLVQRLKTSREGQLMRTASARLHASRMRFDLADARSTTYIADDTKDFIDDRTERGYEWVKAVLDATHPAHRRLVEGHRITVRHIVYEGTKLRDVLLIGAQEEQSIHRVVLYTPDAPDGRTFREFPDRQAAAAGFLNNPAFETYLVDRLPEEWSTTGGNGTRRFRLSPGMRQAIWALSGQSGERPWTMTEGRFTDEEITGDFFEASSDVALGHLGIATRDLARSTLDADLDRTRSIAVGAALYATGFVEALLPLRVAVAIGSVRTLGAVWAGIDSARSDDRHQAFAYFVEAFASASDLVGILPATRALTRTIFTRQSARPRMLTAVRTRMPDHETIFDARYRASSHVRRSDARSVKEGVYAIGVERFIEHDGHLYGVRFDSDNGTWRLKKHPHSPTDYGPPVVRDATGAWRHNVQVGLRGGSGRPERPDLFDREPMDVLKEYRTLRVETAALTDNDLEIMIRTFTERGLRAGVMKRLIFDRTHDMPISADMDRHWNAAIGQARRRPPRITVPVPSLQGFELTKLERSQWPARVWHYTTPDRLAQFQGTTIALHQSLDTPWGPSGLHVMTLDPATPPRRIVEVMRGTRRSTTFNDRRIDHMTRAHVEIDLDKLRNRQRADGTYEFNLYTVTNRSPQEFVLKPTLPNPDPDLVPPSPREKSWLPDVLLRPGEFMTASRPSA